MVSRRKLIDFIEHNIRGLRNALSAFVKNGSAGSLHSMRISLKKLRTTCLLLKAASDKNSIVHFDLLRQLNQNAGQIRDLDSIMELLKGNRTGNTESEILSLSKTRKKYQNEFRFNLTSYRSGISLFRKGIIPEVVSLDENYVSDFYKKQNDKITRHLEDFETNKTGKLHRTRKRIKTVLYLKELLSLRLRHKLHPDWKRFDKMQHLIGQWHDAVAAMIYFHKAENYKTERKLLSEIQKTKLEKLKKITDEAY